MADILFDDTPAVENVFAGGLSGPSGPGVVHVIGDRGLGEAPGQEGGSPAMKYLGYALVLGGLWMVLTEANKTPRVLPRAVKSPGSLSALSSEAAWAGKPAGKSKVPRVSTTLTDGTKTVTVFARKQVQEG